MSTKKTQERKDRKSSPPENFGFINMIFKVTLSILFGIILQIIDFLQKNIHYIKNYIEIKTILFNIIHPFFLDLILRNQEEFFK